MSNPNFNTYYRRPKGGGLLTELPSRTVQSAAKFCDINYILSRYKTTGQLSNVSTVPPQFLNCEDIVDKSNQAFAFVKASEDYFASLPADIREEVGSAERLASLMDDNPELATKLGFAIRPEPEVTLPANPVNPVPEVTLPANPVNPVPEVTLPANNPVC